LLHHQLLELHASDLEDASPDDCYRQCDHKQAGESHASGYSSRDEALH
jgi:hypothetical protein